MAAMLSSVNAVSSVQQLSSARMSSFHRSAITSGTVRATTQSSSSVEERRPGNVTVALVAAGAALTVITLTPVLPAYADAGHVERGDEGRVSSGVNLKVPDVGDAVRRKVEGAKKMAENAKSTVDDSAVAEDVTNSAGEVAKNAAQSAVTNSAEQAVEGVKSVVSS